MKPVTFEPGEVLFKEGDPSPDMYYIHTGHVKVVRKGVELPMIGAGKTVGEMGFFRKKPRSATVFVSGESKVEVQALRITEENWQDFARDYPGVVFAIATEAFDRLEVADEKIVELMQELNESNEMAGGCCQH